MSIRAYKINVCGRVTGVCFRMNACSFARQYPDLRGYVRNVSSFEVESVVQGEPHAVDAMVEWFKHGPAYARVDEMTVVEVPVAMSLHLYKIIY